MIPQDGETFLLEHPCGYFHDARPCTSHYIAATGPTSNRYAQYLAEGYRRVGSFFYRPQCPDCALCLPLRVPVKSFAPSRSQRRTLRVNTDVLVEVGDPRVTDEKLALYARYQRLKHGRHVEPTEAALDSALHTELCTIHYGYPLAMEMRFLVSGRLMGVSIVDAAEGALSSNYFYYETDLLPRRPGILSLLKELELARALGLTYHYLGYWVSGCCAMQYKAQFRPADFLDRDGSWQPLAPGAGAEE